MEKERVETEKSLLVFKSKPNCNNYTEEKERLLLGRWSIAVKTIFRKHL